MNLMPPSPLYKFSSFEGGKAILEYRCLWTKSPLDFNDPFEVLPAFDEDRKNESILSRRRFYQHIRVPGGGNLTAEGDDHKTPVEDFVDLAGIYHDPFFASIYTRFRVLCFSEEVSPILLWSHYAASHSGIALGFDLNKGNFPLGRISAGLPVDYISDRSALLLPLDYYTFKGAQMIDPNPAPIGHVKTSSGIIITQADQQARYLDCLKTMLRHKCQVWEYEKERRFLYDLSLSWEDGLKDTQPDSNGNTHKAAFFEPDAITDIVFGYRCTPEQIHSLLPIIETLPSVRLHYVDFHPTDYEVRVFQGDFLQIHATHSMRRQRMTFRYTC
jgi:hypothetical protein